MAGIHKMCGVAKMQTLVQNARTSVTLEMSGTGIGSLRVIPQKMRAPIHPDKIQPQKLENGTP